MASPNYLMQWCRIVLQHVADANKRQVLKILIGGPKGHGTSKVGGMVAQPLDFRTIDVCLVAGDYGRLPKAFASYVQQVRLLHNGNLYFNNGFVIFFFFHFYMKLLPTNLSIIELEGPSHILNFANMEERGRSSWEWQ